MGVERQRVAARPTLDASHDRPLEEAVMTRRPPALRPTAKPSEPRGGVRFVAESPWYELFSRGARDWLRHNQKLRQAVRAQIVDLLADSDLITQPNERTVRVPVKLLEHARFRLAEAQKQTGAGQGAART